MNCKPGDLAVILAPRNGGECDLTGNLCRVVRLAPAGDVRLTPRLVMVREGIKAPLWVIELMAPSLVVGKRGGEFGFEVTRVQAMWDARLKPFRDPGDDAVDESTAWLPPVPTKEKEHA